MSNQANGDGRDMILNGHRPLNTVAGSGLYRRRRTLPPAAPPEEDPLDEMGKALFDAVVEVLPDVAQKALAPLQQEAEARLHVTLGATLQKELDARGHQHESQLAALRNDFQSAFAAQAKLYEDRLANQAAAHADALDRLHKLHEAGLAGLKAVLQALPTPQVTVPAEAIVVKQLPSTVNLSPRIENPAPVIHVKNEVPQQAAPVINVAPAAAPVVNVPAGPAPVLKIEKGALRVELEQKPSVVNLEVGAKAFTLLAPPPRTTRTIKSVVYGPDGRPARIEETTTEEPEQKETEE